eukprot:UN28086
MQLQQKCRSILIRTTNLKKLGFEGLDQPTIMEIIEDTLKLSVKSDEDREILGKVMCLLNNCYLHSPTMVTIENNDDAKDWLQKIYKMNKYHFLISGVKN